LLAFGPDGSHRWKASLGFETVASPAIADDGTIYIGSRNRSLYAIAPDGQQKWSFRTGGWVDSSAAIGTNGTVYFGSWDGKFYALTPEGRKKWEFNTDAPVVSSPAIDLGGRVYFGSHDGRLYALNPDGSKRWDFPTRGQILSSPAIADNGDVLFTSLDGRLYAVDVAGKQRWSLHTGGITAASPVVGLEGAVFLGVNSNHCMISAEGRWQWQRGLSPTGYAPWDWIASTPTALADGKVAVTGTDLMVTIFKPDGDWSWNYSLLSGGRASLAVGPDGTIYATGRAGKIFALLSTTPAAETSWPMYRGNPQRNGRAQIVR
jgi:outer membrane protein assembly factor BamB